MKVGIYTNINKDDNLIITKQLISKLKLHNMEFKIYTNLTDYFDYNSFDEDNIDVDIVFSLGGDGTILRLVRICAVKNIPIFGINLGTVGFLTEEDPDNLDKILSALENNEYSIEYRTMLSAFSNDHETFALNDIVINRDNSRLVVLYIYINDNLVDRYYCDGFIVATPTGSTAYSLSAGGPILSPNANVFALTSINSHTLHSRPIVVNDEDTIKLQLKGKDSSAIVVADGNNEWSLNNEDEIIIKKSNYRVGFIRLKGQTFYDKLLTKLNNWSVTLKEDRTWHEMQDK